MRGMRDISIPPVCLLNPTKISRGAGMNGSRGVRYHNKLILDLVVTCLFSKEIHVFFAKWNYM